MINSQKTSKVARCKVCAKDISHLPPLKEAIRGRRLTCSQKCRSTQWFKLYKSVRPITSDGYGSINRRYKNIIR